MTSSMVEVSGCECVDRSKKEKERAKMNRQFKKEDIKTAVNTRKNV